MGSTTNGGPQLTEMEIVYARGYRDGIRAAVENQTAVPATVVEEAKVSTLKRGQYSTDHGEVSRGGEGR